ncbi:MAG: hypothetical protein GX111_05705 [Clostridiales bacterium]|nr:hypothetical protein [Clostridiales bacterium]
MKKTLALLLALTLLAAFFAACGPKDPGVTQPSDQPTASAPEQSGEPQTSDEPVDEGPYNLAVGKYETDANGVPLTRYQYELPLSTTDEVFTYLTSPMIVEAVPESGYEDLAYPAMLAEKTGVNIEYILIPFGNRWDNMSILVASDDIPNLSTNIDWFFPGPLQQAIDDEYIVNLYDYKEYMPNYFYEINSHPDDINVMAKIMPVPETIYAFYCFESEYVTRNSGAARGDWLEKLGMTNEDVVTIDDLHNLLKLFQTECGAETPYLLLSGLDSHGIFSPAFDTNFVVDSMNNKVAPPVVVDGQVQFCNSRPEDKEAMTLVNQWWNEGLIQPNWMSTTAIGDYMPLILDGTLGVIGLIPGEANDYSGINNQDPNAYWVPIQKVVKEEGQVFHLGDGRTWITAGNWAISPKCDNIPLLVTYCDWFYSEEGIFLSNWGVEGEAFYYDENGKPMLTDFLINHPSGMSWALLQYTMNDICEGGIIMRSKTYAIPGGEQFAEFHTFWDSHFNCDRSMQWPSAVTFTAEQDGQLANLGIDIQTYIAENFLLFVDGSTPLSEWDSYVAGLDQLGWAECRQIYQDAYDAFMEKY